MQNCFAEMYDLLDLLVPGCLGPDHRTFEEVRRLLPAAATLAATAQGEADGWLAQHYGKPIRLAQAKGAIAADMRAVRPPLLPRGHASCTRSSCPPLLPAVPSLLLAAPWRCC